MKSDQEMQQLAKSITDGLGMEPVDLDLFDLALEQEFAPRLAKAVELFAQSPDRLWSELEDLLWELSWLEKHFAEREEYERCSIVQAQRGIIERKLLYARKKKGRRRVSSAKRPK